MPLAEHFFPGAGGFEAGRLPHLAKLGNQGILVALEVVHQFLRNGLRESLVGQGRAVAGVSGHSHFVFHLDHDDGVLAAVDFAHVPHEGRKGAGIGVAVGIAAAA